MRTVIKTIITTVLLSTTLAMAGNVEARLKYYRYNDNIPMVEMSLNMMVAMGVLEPIPSRLVHDGNPYHRMVSASYSPYSRSSYSYPDRSRRYGDYRYYDHLDGPFDFYDSYYGGYNNRYYGSRYDYLRDYPRYRTWGSRWNSPWADRWGDQWDSPWGNMWGDPWDYPRSSPWSSTWGNRWGNQWGNPGDYGWDNPWGNQWSNPWNSSWGSPWGYQWDNPWNSIWGSPWGNSWSNPWMNPWYSQLGYPGAWPYTQGYSSLPQALDALQGNDSLKNNSYQPDESSRQYGNGDKGGHRAEKTSWTGRHSSERYKRSGYRNGNKRTYRKLNGLWIGDNGSMLGIRGNHFLWYDDNNQYAKGQLVKSPTMMKARIEGSATVVRYHYRLRGNELVIMSGDGKMHTFNRMPLVEPAVSARPRAAYTSYIPEGDHSRFSHSNDGPGLKANNRSLNSRNRSDRAGRGFDVGKRTHSMAPREYYSFERASARSPYQPYSGHRSKDDNPSVTRPADSDSDFYTADAFINDAGPERQQLQQNTPSEPADADSAAPASTIPLVKQYQPAAGKPASADRADVAEQPAEDVSVKPGTWTNYAGQDMNDPNTYLYSYLKDNDVTRTSTDSPTDPGDRDSAVGSTAALKRDDSNIWKPNNAYPDRRGYTGNSSSNNSAQNRGWGGAELATNSGMKKFTWPDGGKPWN